jgi:hypothetical protein
MKYNLSNLAVAFVLSVLMIESSSALSVRPHKSNRIYQVASASGADYRYGPSIIRNADGSLDLWATETGNGQGIWDYIEYRRSVDNGKTWTNIKRVLAPSAGGKDSVSVADPSVIYYGGYYYLAYTGINNQTGGNDIFIARSTTPSGTYGKWNGTGWGGNSPVPIIDYNGSNSYYGIGAPSLLIKGSTLYIYYGNVEGPGISGTQERYATTVLTNANWPKNLVFHGAISYFDTAGVGGTNRIGNSDSLNVYWLEDENLFLGWTVRNQIEASSFMVLFISTDGVNFYETCSLRDSTMTYANNCGMSADVIGHVKLSDRSFVAYANGGATFGRWNLDMLPITFRNLYGIKKWSTGSGKIEVHNVDGAANFTKYYTQSATSAAQITSTQNSLASFCMDDWAGTTVPDLFTISKSGTGSSKVEVHVLSGASGYQTYSLHATTLMGLSTDPTTFSAFTYDWDRDGRADVITVHKTGTGSGKMDLRVMGAKDNYSSYLLQVAMPLVSTTVPESWVFGMGDWNRDGITDLYAIQKSGTSSGKVEVHVLNGANNFQSFLSEQLLPITFSTSNGHEFSVADWDGDGIADLVLMSKNQTGSNKTEVHILKGTGDSRFGYDFQNYIWNSSTALPTCSDEFTLNLW